MPHPAILISTWVFCLFQALLLLLSHCCCCSCCQCRQAVKDVARVNAASATRHILLHTMRSPAQPHMTKA